MQHDANNEITPDQSSALATIFLTEIELAERWKVSYRYLANLRYRKISIPFTKLGNVIRYELADVVAHEANNKSSNSVY